MIDEILPAEIFGFFLVFVRLGTAIMLLPAVGEQQIPTPIRLVLGLAIAFALSPFAAPLVPPQPANPIAVFLLVAGEFVIGALIGGSARFLMSALNVGGTIIGFSSSLAFALTVDPTKGVQGAMVASFLSILGVVLVFATGLHLLLIRGLAESYVLFPPGDVPPVGDFSELATKLLSDAFRLGAQIAAPFIVYGIILYTAVGILGRLTPQLPIFFVILPLQIWAAFFVLMVSLSAIMLWFMQHFEDGMIHFLVAR
jgi:flagellar biosynthetic protein FliR